MDRFLMRIYRDPAEGEQGGGAPGTSQESIDLEQALLDEGGDNANTDTDKGAGPDKADDKAPAAGDKGKGKGAPAADEDPEVEIDQKDDKGVVTKGKVKMSELKQGYMRQQDYTTKTQRLAEIEKNQKDLITTVEAIRGNPKLAKLFVGMVEGAISKEGYNEAFIDKHLNALTEVQAAPDDNKADLKDKNEDIEELLKDVDADSPIAKALRATHAANKKIMADMKALTDAHGKTAKTVEDRTTAEQQKEYDKLVEGAAGMMNTHLDGMTDAAAGGLDFFTEEEKKEWRYKVVAFLRDNPFEYKDDKEFVARIDQVGKAVHAYQTKYRESIIARQLEGNKLPKKPKIPIDKPNPDAATLEEDILRELEALDGIHGGGKAA